MPKKKRIRLTLKKHMRRNVMKAGGQVDVEARLPNGSKVDSSQLFGVDSQDQQSRSVVGFGSSEGMANVTIGVPQNCQLKAESDKSALPRSAKMRCIVPSCNHRQRSSCPVDNLHKVDLYALPKDRELAQVWLEKCGGAKAVLGTSSVIPIIPSVCSRHFLPTDYIQDTVNKILGFEESISLKKDAVPSVALLEQMSAGESRSNRKRKRKSSPGAEVHALPTQGGITTKETSVVVPNRNRLHGHTSQRKLDSKFQSGRPKVISSLETFTGQVSSGYHPEFVTCQLSSPIDAINADNPTVDNQLWACDSCNQEFPNFEALTGHVTSGSCLESGANDSQLIQPFPKRIPKRLNSQQWFSCLYCRTRCMKTFKVLHMSGHKADQEAGKPYICFYCPAKFESGHQRNAHEDRHTRPLAPFPCKTCPDKFYSKAELLRHKKKGLCVFKKRHFVESQKPGASSKHAPVKFWICRYCHQQIPREDSLPAHFKRHRFCKPLLKCKICEDIFSTTTLDAEPVEQNTISTPKQKCRYCMETFVRPGCRDNHQEIAHPKLRCSFCTEMFAFGKTEALDEHMKERHTWQCLTCGLVFSTSNSLEIHKIHNFHALPGRQVKVTNQETKYMRQPETLEVNMDVLLRNRNDGVVEFFETQQMTQASPDQTKVKNEETEVEQPEETHAFVKNEGTGIVEFEYEFGSCNEILVDSPDLKYDLESFEN